MKRISLIIIASLVSELLFAQKVEMADTMRDNGKIYVVVAVVAVVFAVITAYIITVDKKIGKLEKNTKK